MLPSSGSVSAAIADARMRGTVEAIVRAHVQARSPSQAQPGKAKRCAVDTLRKTNSDSAAAPASATMTGAQFFRSADSAEPRSEEHTSELQSLMSTSYAVFCLKRKNTHKSIAHQEA